MRSLCCQQTSLGTGCLSPSLIHSAVCLQLLVDPACMMVCCPDLLYNFIYRLPNMAEALSPLGFMDLIRYFCARDLIISEVKHCAVFKLRLWCKGLCIQTGCHCCRCSAESSAGTVSCSGLRTCRQTPRWSCPSKISYCPTPSFMLSYWLLDCKFLSGHTQAQVTVDFCWTLDTRHI